MKRREFIALGAAATFLPFAARANEGWIDYQEGVLTQLLAEDKTVLIDYAATWCSTCKAQERVITALRQENPAFNAAIEFVRVDWDTFSRAPITTGYNIPRRSTLLLLQGDTVLGQLVADTRRNNIEELMSLAL